MSRQNKLFNILSLVLILFQCSEKKSSFHEYIAYNYFQVDLKKQNSNFNNLFENDLAANEIFFSSESHAIAKNQELEVRFLEYFVKHANVKYLLIEGAYSNSQLINSYLESGDESTLREFMTGLEGTLSYTKQYYLYWKEIYKLNRNLSKNNKIYVVGIDLEHSTKVSISYLNSLLSKTELAELPLLQDLLANNNKKLDGQELIRECQSAILELRDSRSNQLDENKIFDTQFVLKNLINRIDAFSEEQNHDIHRKRDQFMYENFIELYARLPKGKYFGQWGLNHVYQSKQLDINWLGCLLNASPESPVRGKVLSIATFYNDSERVKWRSKETESLDEFYPSLDTLGISIASNSFYLFRLNAVDSPFKKELFWYFPSQPETGVTTDFFQYMIIGNELKASNLYK